MDGDRIKSEFCSKSTENNISFFTFLKFVFANITLPFSYYVPHLFLKFPLTPFVVSQLLQSFSEFWFYWRPHQI